MDEERRLGLLKIACESIAFRIGEKTGEFPGITALTSAQKPDGFVVVAALSIDTPCIPYKIHGGPALIALHPGEEANICRYDLGTDSLSEAKKRVIEQALADILPQLELTAIPIE